MPVDAGLATLSDQLFTWAIVLYSVALVGYCGEYAFGRRGRVAATSPATAPAVEPALVGGPMAGAGRRRAGARRRPSASAGWRWRPPRSVSRCISAR